MEGSKSPRELLYSRLIEVLGPEEANTLMQHLPAFEMPDLATRAEFSQLEGKMGAVETRMTGLETRMGGLETRMGGLETRMDGLELKLDAVITAVEKLEAQMHSDRRTMVASVIGAVVGLAAVVISSQVYLLSLV